MENINIFSGPLHGNFVNQGRQLPVTSFSVHELDTSAIGYQLNPLVKADTDMCLLQVTDGYHVLSFIVNFQIRQKVRRTIYSCSPFLYDHPFCNERLVL